MATEAQGTMRDQPSAVVQQLCVEADSLLAQLRTLKEEQQQLRSELVALREEQAQLRGELERLQTRLGSLQSLADLPVVPDERTAGRWPRSRLYRLLLLLVIVGLPVLAITVWKLDAFQSTVLALLVYTLGPGITRLLLEGLVRAIPGVLLGQTVRIAIDNVRNRWRSHSG